MKKIIELYQCQFVPSLIPEFIDPHITVDEEFGKEVYIIEVNPSYPIVAQAKKNSGGVERLLEQYKVVKPVMFYSGECPDFGI